MLFNINTRCKFKNSSFFSLLDNTPDYGSLNNFSYKNLELIYILFDSVGNVRREGHNHKLLTHA